MAAFDMGPFKKPQRSEAITATFFGEHGSGKTSLAAEFPNPVFIRTEDGTSGLAGRDGILESDLCTSTKEVFDLLTWLANEQHQFKTIVIDTVTALDEIIKREIVEEDGSETIEKAHGGFGKAYAAVAAKHGEVWDWCYQICKKKGINVIFLAHAKLIKQKSADTDEYFKFSIQMNEQSSINYTNKPELVAFIKQKFFLKSEDPPAPGKVTRTKKAGNPTEGRLINCDFNPHHVGKNRLDIEGDLVYYKGTNPFEQYLNQTTKGE